MPCFKINKHKIINNVFFSSYENIKDVIFENNKIFFDVTKEFPFEALVIECENKPRNMPIFNIFWEKVI